MKINRFKLLSSFRGLTAGYEIKFSTEPNPERIEPICFVGLNGSGKSNILEALSEAFFYLEAYSKEISKSEYLIYETEFGFEIEYELDPTWQESNAFWEKLGEINWSVNETIKIQFIKLQKKLPEMKIHLGEKSIIVSDPEYFILPNRIIAYTSGMNELISNPFHKIDFFYIESLRDQSRNLDIYRPQMNRMFLLDYEANKIATVCSQIYSKDNKINLLNQELKIEELVSFSIYVRLDRPNYKDFKFPSSINLIIEKLLSCSEEIVSLDRKSKKKKLFFKINSDTRNLFHNNWEDAYNLFRDLYRLRLMNIFLNSDTNIKRARHLKLGKNLNSWLQKPAPINQIFYIDEIIFKNQKNENIYYKHLSDGEHQLLHSLSGLMLLESKNSIFIFDEPDTHFNPEWRSKYISLLNEVLKEKVKEQVIFLTSHSPFVISDCKPENVYIFNKNENPKSAKDVEFNTFGASIDNILKNFFGNKNLISEYSYNVLKKLIEEGTAEELRNAIDEFGESSEKQFLFRKLYEKNLADNVD
ncbi:MAG: restriction system-associated AAA family ATPase [Leptospira sp.]|uniref:restriction system-associated AAA family ATPase n=1 Tax=Leptospira sp. TaxID=178 RepID=UPI0025C70A48|nr:restriction system-associated AAA family ATPase [Leptospira sp.]MBL0953136.1 restriction system-associated AAA family ATPase [Leptospira sp.]